MWYSRQRMGTSLLSIGRRFRSGWRGVERKSGIRMRGDRCMADPKIDYREQGLCVG